MSNSTFPKDVLNELQSHCLRRGTMDAVNTHQPEQVPGTGVTCAIWMQRLGPARNASGLAATSVRLEYGIRLYYPLTSRPADVIDTALLEATSDLMMSFTSDFTLAGMTRAVDLLGAFGTPLEAVAGYVDQDGTKFRVMTITFPVVVDDVWDQAE